MATCNRIEYPVEQIRQWILEGRTQKQIASKLQEILDPRVTHKMVYKVCKKHGIKCWRGGPHPREGHKNWKGGRRIDKDGYVEVFCPDHPKNQRLNELRAAKADGRYYRKARYIREHRLVMERHLGRYLFPHEVVHHIDGNPSNNVIGNLRLYQANRDHLAETLKGKCPNWTPEGRARIGKVSWTQESMNRMRVKAGERKRNKTTGRFVA